MRALHDRSSDELCEFPARCNVHENVELYGKFIGPNLKYYSLLNENIRDIGDVKSERKEFLLASKIERNNKILFPG